MALKRKLELEGDDASPVNAKQLKLFPFPHYESDDDVAMSEAEPLHSDIHHARIASNASSTSSDASGSPLTNSPEYPTFDLYPLPFFNSDGSVDPNSHNYTNYSGQSFPSPSVRLLQPSSSFSHHGTGCVQIPKLLVACSSGLNGQRTMWSLCEQCGAISMVENVD